MAGQAVAITSSNRASERPKKYKLEGELARRVKEVRKIVEERNGKISYEERVRFCHYIADACREWSIAYHRMCDNLEFVVDKAITQREVWYRFMSIAPKEVLDFVDKKARQLKRDGLVAMNS